MRKITLLLTSFLICNTVYAEGNFFGADFGSSAGYPDSTGLMASGLVAAGASSAHAQQKTGSLGFSVFGGSWFSENIGWELGYDYLGGIDGSWTAVGALPGTYDYTASAFHWAFLGGTQAGTGKIIGKIGVYRASTESKWAITGGSSSTGTNSNMGLMLGAGYEAPISSNFSARFGVDVFNGVDFQEIAYGTPVKQTMYRVAFGLMYNF